MSAPRWAICSRCDGEGKHSGHLGAFTGSEWEQEDDDFKERYMQGDYDRACERCEGTGKVLRTGEPKICQCCGEEMGLDQQFCCSDDFPEPGDLREWA
ncbi:MAG: hypothetical protein V4457_06060 [Pseudomonadota bacterium]